MNPKSDKIYSTCEAGLKINTASQRKLPHGVDKHDHQRSRTVELQSYAKAYALHNTPLYYCAPRVLVDESVCFRRKKSL